ncbi:MAG: hypothetical protein NTW59_04635 [Candidatus Diapherotrites archaeon]|nr:hypothetical protein [Candidatus Diapherotrites archaeon]
MAVSDASRARALFERIVKWVKLNRAAVVLALVGIVFLLFFWAAVLFTAIAVACIFGAIALWAKLRYKKPPLKALFSEKKKLLEAIKIAEGQYMRRKMAEKDFNLYVKEKQRQLIELEASIDQQYNKQMGKPVTEEMLAVQAKKRHILKELLGEKQRLVKELNLAENSYLRRKIDVPTYQAIVQEKQQKLIDMEAQIKQIYAEANITKVMDNLKGRLAQLEQEKKGQKKKRETSEREKELEIAREIVEQMQREKV